MTRSLLLTTALLLSLLPAAAAQTERERMAACLDKAPHTQAMSQCAVAAFQAADKQLNSLYQSVLANQKPAAKKNLVAAQLAWLKFRDSYCTTYLAAGLKGADKTYIQQRCFTELTVERNGHLSDLLVSP